MGRHERGGLLKRREGSTQGSTGAPRLGNNTRAPAVRSHAGGARALAGSRMQRLAISYTEAVAPLRAKSERNTP
jgi:hypothetical protein